MVSSNDITMNHPIPPYRIFPLGDSAATIDFGNTINESVNQKVLDLFYELSNDPLPGMTEAVPAYSSLTIHYNVFVISKNMNGSGSVFDFMSEQLNERLKRSLPGAERSSRLINIPVCYEKGLAPDIDDLAREKNLSVDELIGIHTGRPYRVFMLGFLPGFSYMGEVDEKIAIRRKPQPEMVAAGSIGIAGRQTGIYPVSSPGGWHIIGRTPLKLFDWGKDEPSLLKAGDMVQFISITKNEFENY